MEVVIRATIAFWILWTLLRASGKRELAQMTPFELIVLMVLGDLIQQSVTQEDMTLVGNGLAVSTIVLWALALSYLTFRSRRLQPALKSRPAILIEGGVVDEEMLHTERLTLEDLHEEARNAGVGDLGRVKWGILEADGKMSFVTQDVPPG